MKLTIKRLFSLAAVLLLSLSLVACGKKDDKPVKPDDGGNDKPVPPVVDVEVDKEITDADLIGLASGKRTYITTVGQSDMEKVEQVFRIFTKSHKNVGVTVTPYGQADPEADPAKEVNINLIQKSSLTAKNVKDDLANHEGQKAVVFLVTGTSQKGLGSAGVKLEGEIERAEQFAAAAAADELEIVLLHVGGKSRRGGNSDPVIEAVCGAASVALVCEEGNQDKFFDKFNVPLYLYSGTGKIASAIEALFNIK